MLFFTVLFVSSPLCYFILLQRCWAVFTLFYFCGGFNSKSSSSGQHFISHGKLKEAIFHPYQNSSPFIISTAATKHQKGIFVLAIEYNSKYSNSSLSRKLWTQTQTHYPSSLPQQCSHRSPAAVLGQPSFKGCKEEEKDIFRAEDEGWG